MRVGVEVGGTFTDLVAIADGELIIKKVPSVPARPNEGAFNAIAASEVDISCIHDLAHGSTVATNALIERKGRRIAFITTAGFQDLLALQRHTRREIYNLRYAKPLPVVDRASSFEVGERVDGTGNVIQALDEDEVCRTLIPALKEGNYSAAAICLLNAYLNPVHEEQLTEIIRGEIPHLLVTPSNEVTREFREFERASTTSISAYVRPVIDAYISEFEHQLDQGGFKGHFSVMQSNGGRLPPEGIRRNAVAALLSGPAAGVMGAVNQVGRSGYSDLITLDMGGTSTDVCLVEEGTPQLTTEFEMNGLPIRTPVLDINTVGAGGGSIVWLDDGGMLRVGPESAGAIPGPACYCGGGVVPTITDAHVVRGTIPAGVSMGDRHGLDRDAASYAFTPIARELGLSVESTADSAIRLANANIVRAIQLVSTERGKDPRDYVLVPFGGAGPLHAAEVAAELGMDSVVVPPHAGVTSAYGLLAADFIQFESVTRRMRVDQQAVAEIQEHFACMTQRAEKAFQSFDLSGPFTFTLVLDMRFVGQAFEIPVEINENDVGRLSSARLTDAFAGTHERLFHHGASARQEIEVVCIRLRAAAPSIEVPRLKVKGDTGSWQRSETEAFVDGGVRKILHTARGSVMSGNIVKGYALLGESTSTAFVPEGWKAISDSQQNLALTRNRYGLEG